MLNVLELKKELELKEKNRGKRGYKSMSIGKLLNIPDASEPIRDIRKENSNTDKIPKNTKTFFRLEKDKYIKNRELGDIRNPFRLEKNKNIKDRVLKDVKTLFESDKADYYKPIRIDNASSSNYFECECNRDKAKTLFIDDHLDKTKMI